MTASSGAVRIVEVGPRDGFQGIAPFIPTDAKIGYVRRLHAAGLRRIEIGSFVSPQAVPQLRDTAGLLRATVDLPGFDPQVLVANERRAREALAAGARHLGFVLSVSEAHNRSNVRRSPGESVREYELLLRHLPPGVGMRLNIATAFDCPFDGRVPVAATVAMLDRLLALRPDVEACLCDTTGRVVPDHVAALASLCRARYGAATSWAFHAHDTYGLGLANVHAAYGSGIRVIDASFAGLGGCPFAPGATGNVATEDVVWMFRRMGIETGVDLDALLPIAADGAAIAGALPGGRARDALLRQAKERPAPG